MTKWLSGTGFVLGVGLVLAVAPAAEPNPPGFTPVVPAAAVQAALEYNLKLVRDWLGDKDYVSAAQSAQGLAALAQLYRYQSAEPAWQQKNASLRQSCAMLLTASGAKKQVDCDKCARDCEKILAELAKSLPAGAKVVEPNFKAFGSTKTWMLLMDGAYVDAKTARSAQEMENLASILAEEANLVTHQRGDASWRKTSLDLRTTALAVAAKAHANDLEGARKDLKQVYQRCEACHETTRRR